MVRIERGAELRNTANSGGWGAVQRTDAHRLGVKRSRRRWARLADGSTAKKNFNIFYEIDGEEVGSVLRAEAGC